jgi:hypothetical protein
MSSVTVEANLDLDNLAGSISCLPEEDVLKFILRIDDLMCDEGFTKALRKELKKALNGTF